MLIQNGIRIKNIVVNTTQNHFDFISYKVLQFAMVSNQRPEDIKSSNGACIEN